MMVLVMTGIATGLLMVILFKFALLHIKIRMIGFHHRCIGIWYVCKAQVQRHRYLVLIVLTVLGIVSIVSITTANNEANEQYQKTAITDLRRSDGETVDGEKMQNHLDGSPAGTDLSPVFSENGFIFQNSSYELLTNEDIENLRNREIAKGITFKAMLQYAINEIYARHGRRFTAEEYINFYTGYEWYTPTVDEVCWAEFNEFEKSNITSLIDVQKKYGYRKS